MMRFHHVYVLCALALTSGTVSAGIVTYDANAAFVANELGVTETNPSFGPFKVGYSGTNGVFTEFNASDHTNNWLGNTAMQGFDVNNYDPAVVVNTSVSSQNVITGAPNPLPIDPSQILMHPGNTSSTNENAILRFIAPTAGVYVITGDFESLHWGVTNNAVFHNGVSLFSSTADNSNFDLTATLAVNDHIDFVVNRGGDAYNGDSTGLRASLSLTQAVPEPSTAIATGLLGVVGFAGRRRRRRSSDSLPKRE
ncbi:MAG: PEP-CTERM sorting domain-containing protein [Rubripirellula sp.]